MDENGNSSGFFSVEEIDYSIPDDPSNILVSDDGTLRAGTLTKIVQRLTSYESHVSSLFDFLTTYRSYATPRYLLALLRRRFEQIVDGEDIKVVRLRTMLFMRQWIERNAADWIEDQHLMDSMSHFIASWEDIDPTTQRTAQLCSSSMQRALDLANNDKNDGSLSPKIVFSAPTPPAEIPTETDPSKLQFTQISIMEVARQWTLLEWKYWVAIKPSEFLNLAWTRKNKEEIAPNIVTLTKNFNSAAGWIATKIQRVQELKERAKMLGRMIQLAEELRALSNFSGLMAVLSGLESASVYRLKQTWELVPTKLMETYTNLKSLMSSELSFKRYREHLKNVNPPTIPYLGISLTDLTFIYEGSRDYSHDGLINFSKCHMVSETLKTISQYQDISYNFEVVPVIRTFLQFPVIWDEGSRYAYSLWNEPRPGTEPTLEPPAIVYLESGFKQVATETTQSIRKPFIEKEPPKEWKSSSLVIRRSVLRAADLYHACCHLVYLDETDAQYIHFNNVFFHAIKPLGGLDKILSTFEAILAAAPLTDDFIPHTTSQTFLQTSPRSGSRKSDTMSITISSAPLRSSEGMQKSQSASSVSSPRSMSSASSLDSDSDNQPLKPRRKMSSEILIIHETTSSSTATTPTATTPIATTPKSPRKSRRPSKDDSSSGADTSSEEKPPSPRSQSATLKPKRRQSRRGSSQFTTVPEEGAGMRSTMRDSSEFASLGEPYSPPKTKIELARTMLDVCNQWGARYTAMTGANRESKSLQLLPAWMESKLSQVDSMRDFVQTAVTSFVRLQTLVPVDASKRHANALPKSHPCPTVPPAQQTIRMYHAEEIARQLAIWHQSEFATFTRDELFALSAYGFTSAQAVAALPSRSTYTILKALSDQLYDWIKNELTPLSEKTKKKTLAPSVELFIDVLHYSVELNNFLAARSIYRAIEKCVVGDPSMLEADGVSKKSRESLEKLVTLFTHGSGSVWNQRIASTQMSTAEPPMVLPMEWLESAIAHNQTEKDWWKGRGIFSFDKLGMVKQTWRGIERVTKSLYNLQPVPMLKDFLLTSMAGDSVLQSLMHNSTLSSLPILKKAKEGKLPSIEDSGRDDSSTSNNSTASASSSRDNPSSPHSDISSSRDYTGSAPSSSSALSSNGGKERSQLTEHIRAASSKEGRQRPSSVHNGVGAAKSSTTMRGGAESVSPRGSRAGSASSGEGSVQYGNTPDFRNAVLKMLGEDEDFRHSVISSLVSLGAITPPSASSTMRGEGRSSPKKRKLNSESNRISTLEAEVDRLKRLTSNTATNLSDSDSQSE